MQKVFGSLVTPEECEAEQRAKFGSLVTPEQYEAGQRAKAAGRGTMVSVEQQGDERMQGVGWQRVV